MKSYSQAPRGAGQHYSGRNRIPNITEFMQRLDQEKANRDAEINATGSHGQAAQVPKPSIISGFMRNPNPPAPDIHDNDDESTDFVGDAVAHKPERRQKKGWRTVRDPVTGKDIKIQDIDMNYQKVVDNPKMSVPNENLGRPTTVPMSSEMSGEEYRHAQDIMAPPDPVQPGATSDVPIRSEKTSILFYKTPSVSYEPMFEMLEMRASFLSLGLFLVISLVGNLFGARIWGIVPLAGGVSCAVFLWAKELIRQGRDREWESERERGEMATANLIPESAEWMNTMIGLVCGLINPEMFSGVADTIEDVMVASVPGIIENVRVADISQGSNAIRVLSLRALPDNHMQDVKNEQHKENIKTMDPEELAATQESGAFYNLEASVAYHAKPSSADVSSKAKNMGMRLVFYLGVRGLFGVPLPVWVELIGMVATVRMRIQLTPEPPFLKTLTFTLMGIPKVQAGCTPMVERGINILNLPLISNFVNWAIKTAASMYVAPKSMTLDIASMLSGDDIARDTTAIGVIFIKIRRGVDLSKQDRRGSHGGGSDPYVTVSWSKFSKPLFCTRVIQDYLNPIFEESCGLLVTPDTIRADEKISMELWDSDRSSADDIVGKIELSIESLMETPNQMFEQKSSLKGLKAESSMPGHLIWEVGFFEKAPFRESKKVDREAEMDAQTKEEEKNAVLTPPDQMWPSGILSIVVHQIVGLELNNIKGSNGKRKGREYEPGRPEAGAHKEEQGGSLPSSYCTILLNDNLVYKTRTKAVSSQPIFNAGTEQFVRDWRSCIVTVTVRDYRNREHDPILGVIPLKVPEILHDSSQVTRWYIMDGGIGFGRVRISLLFRSIKLQLPMTQLGWDVGTFEFTSAKLVAKGYHSSHRPKLRLRTGGSSAVVGRNVCSVNRDADSPFVEWDVSNHSGDEKTGTHGLRLPVRYRYRSPVFIEFWQPRKHHAEAFASFWLRDIADREEFSFDLPIWKCNNPTRLSQNYINEDNIDTVRDLDVEEIGRFQFTGRFSPGTDRDHIRFVTDDRLRETIETWEACYAEGARMEEVRPKIQETTLKLHAAAEREEERKRQASFRSSTSSAHGVDAIGEEGENEGENNNNRGPWVARDGTDWSRAFGEDPSQLMSGSRGRKNSTSASEVSSLSSHGYSEAYTTSSVAGDTTHSHRRSRSWATTNSQTQSIPRNNKSAVGESSCNQSHTTDSNEQHLSDPSLGHESIDGQSTKNPIKMLKSYKGRSRDLHRMQRGLMQWKPMRNVRFAKDEAVYAARRVKNLGSLTGRTPDVETEIATNR
ncbi:hypothetical protein TD95_002636 [Thielaviopsis punctulata]|uniref:C2 domain-containing protein n=1 Tax=Thielaviopsis punctulata TaxID=72032 RepID=A0A0F4Z7Y2_9PEZI|nr:hypothetical protein TD95_002636 [Thielaviopsis punctulata]